MGCRRYQQLAALNRSGELSERDAALLAAHIRACPSCAGEAATMEQLQKVVEKVRHMPRDPVDPEVLTGRVLERVAAERVSRPRSALGEVLDRMLDLTLLPLFRGASACVLFLAIGSFLWQSMAIIQDVRQLEKQQADGTARSRPVPQIGYAVDARVVDEVAGADLLMHIDIRPEGDAIIVSGRALAFLRKMDAVVSPAFREERSLVRQDIHEARVKNAGIRSGIRPVLCFTIAEGV